MLIENELSYEEYCEIINSETVKYVVDGKCVGMARLVTDYGYIALVADVIVKPEYQGQGIGTKMINNLLERAKDTLEDGEAMMIQLLAADGKVKFYEKFGFKDRKDVCEAGMYQWLKK